MGSGSPEAVTNLIEEHVGEASWVFIESASLCRNKDTADPVSSMISIETPPTFPLITVALFLTVATVTRCGLTGGDDHCPRQSPPVRFPAGRFSSHGLVVHK